MPRKAGSRVITKKTVSLLDKQLKDNDKRKKTYDDYRGLGQLGRNEDILKKRQKEQGVWAMKKIMGKGLLGN